MMLHTSHRHTMEKVVGFDSQFAQRLVHSRYIDRARFVEFRGELQAIFSAAFLPVAGNRIIRQGLAHRARENSQEMRAIFPRSSRLIFQAQKSFVDEGGPLEGMVGSFSPKVDLGQP